MTQRDHTGVFVIKQILIRRGSVQTSLCKCVGVIHDAITADGIARPVAIGADRKIIKVARISHDRGIDGFKKARLIAGFCKTLSK